MQPVAEHDKQAGNPTADEVSLVDDKSTAKLSNQTTNEAFLAQNPSTAARDKETDSGPTEDDAFLADNQAGDERTTCRTKRVRLCSLVWLVWALLLIPTFLLVAAIIYSMYQVDAQCDSQ